MHSHETLLSSDLEAVSLLLEAKLTNVSEIVGGLQKPFSGKADILILFPALRKNKLFV